MKIIGLMVLVVLIVGCSEQEQQLEEVATPWDDQIETLRDFEELEQFVLDSAKERSKKMEEQLQ